MTPMAFAVGVFFMSNLLIMNMNYRYISYIK